MGAGVQPSGRAAIPRARELAALVRAGRLRAVDVCEHALRLAEDLGERLGAFNFIERDGALREAARVDRAILEGTDPGPLAGVPFAVKDNICTAHTPTTCSSRILKDYAPPYDATAVARLRAAGAIVLGKTNMDEFAMGSSSENSAFRACMNPWDTARVPGGSSGGSAGAVAAGIVPFALGSDTGGSVRQPAAFCGVIGIKPTYGRVSRYGLIAFASSLDQIGVLAGDVGDAALVLSSIGGHDPRDSTSAPMGAEDYTSGLGGGLEGVRFGVPREYFLPAMDSEVERLVREVVGTIEAAGGEVAPISLPHTQYAIPAYYVVATAEASSNLSRFDGVRYGARAPAAGTLQEMYRLTRQEGFGTEVLRRIMLGTYALSAGYYDAFYLKAQKVRTLLGQDFSRAFETVDVILTPTSPTPAFRLGEKIEDPILMYLSDVFTVTANLAGLPAISLPCGLTGAGLPVGAQLIGKPFAEAALLSTAAAVEGLLQLGGMRPPLCAGPWPGCA